MSLYKIFNTYMPRWTVREWNTGLMFGALLLIVLAGLIVARKLTVKNALAASLLYIVLFVVISSTVFTRTSWSGLHYDFDLIANYISVIVSGDSDMLWMDLLNVLLILPVGILLPMSVPIQKENAYAVQTRRNIRSRMAGRIRLSRRFCFTVCFGFLFSLCIETLQLLTGRGVFELADLIHNTAGVVIGFFVYRGAQKLNAVLHSPRIAAGMLSA